MASLPPSAEHPFGTDQLSRDVLSRVVSGARVSLAVAGIAVALSVSLGAAVGLVAGDRAKRPFPKPSPRGVVARISRNRSRNAGAGA